MPQQSIYTIGHGGRTVEAFLELLQRYNIAYLIDVRSQPYSRYQPEFTKQALEGYLNTQGIRYVFMGDRLGGRPDDPNCYIDGKVDYERVRVQEFYLAGLERLEKAWRDELGVVLLCSERHGYRGFRQQANPEPVAAHQDDQRSPYPFGASDSRSPRLPLPI
ncbi:MAG: DUF488 domain-containing protein [Candidatus Promineifilaceae bacterium]